MGAAGRRSGLARAARHACGRDLGLRGHRRAPARGSAQAGFHTRFGHIAVSCVPAGRAGGPARLSRRPALVIAASLWIMIVMPLAFGFALTAFGLGALAPGLYIALVLQASAPPIISSPTFAALLRIDSALSLATMLVCTAAIPVTGPLFAAFFSAARSHPPLALGLRLAALLVVSALAALSSAGSSARNGSTPERPDRRNERDRPVHLRRRPDGRGDRGLARQPSARARADRARFPSGAGFMARSTYVVFARAGQSRRWRSPSAPAAAIWA